MVMKKITGLFVTAIIPALHGCNLKCPFCAIAQRGEATTSYLEPQDYLMFLEGVAKYLPVTRFSLQGFEPLLPDSWELTKALFRVADRYDLETGLVTNGTYLAEHAEELSGLADLVAVSLDSADPRVHEKLRGVPGAFQGTVEGVREAVKHFGDAISVNSVLFPSKEHYLEGMPNLLQSLGVQDWVISPLINFRSTGYQAAEEDIRRILRYYTNKAAAFDVETYLGDELRRYDVESLYQLLSAAALEREEYVIRLSPDGTCSRGKEILGQSQVAPIWDKKESPVIFVKRILADVGRSF